MDKTEKKKVNILDIEPVPMKSAKKYGYGHNKVNLIRKYFYLCSRVV